MLTRQAGGAEEQSKLENENTDCLGIALSYLSSILLLSCIVLAMQLLCVLAGHLVVGAPSKVWLADIVTVAARRRRHRAMTFPFNDDKNAFRFAVISFHFKRMITFIRFVTTAAFRAISATTRILWHFAILVLLVQLIKPARRAPTQDIRLENLFFIIIEYFAGAPVVPPVRRRLRAHRFLHARRRNNFGFGER